MLIDARCSKTDLTFQIHDVGNTAAGPPPNRALYSSQGHKSTVLIILYLDYGGGLANAYPQQGPPQQYQNAPVHFQPQQQANEPFYYQYSDLSGKRKALLIGINYTGTSNALRGCHNDARNVARFLQGQFH